LNRPIPPRTPSPLIVREQPPPLPQYEPAKIITKTLPAPPPPARRVIIRRMPPLPAKPRPVIIEKWLPYKTPPERPVVYERASQFEAPRQAQRNLILQYGPAQVRVEQDIQNAGCYRVDPDIYRAQFGTSLRRTDSIRKVLQDIGLNPDLVTSNGYQTCFPSNLEDYSSVSTSTANANYHYPKQTERFCPDERSSEFIGSGTNNVRRYGIAPTSSNQNQAYY